MLLQYKEAKAEIEERLDESLESHDSHRSLGIRTNEEHDAWTNHQDMSAITFNDIRDIQRKHMPFSQRISCNFAYYLIFGCKS